MDVNSEKTWIFQRKVEEKIKRIGKGKYGRVIKMARKPEYDEYIKTAKITALGIILVGALGFLVYWLWTNVPPFLKDILGS